MNYVSHIFALDLGQVADFSALVLLERTVTDDGEARCAARHIQRWPRGTPYPRVVEGTLKLIGSPGVIDPVLAVDQTGVGRAVVDLFRCSGSYTLRAVTITAGHRWSRQPDGDYHVPKKDLVGCLQSMLGHRRLEIARDLEGAAVLKEEMQKFRVKITAAANETFSGSWREGDHDDIVLALAIGCWVGENAGTGRIEPPSADNRSEYSRAPAGVWASDGRGDDDGRG